MQLIIRWLMRWFGIFIIVIGAFILYQFAFDIENMQVLIAFGGSSIIGVGVTLIIISFDV